MSVVTPVARDRSSTLIEGSYDPQLPKDMFGFPVELKYLAAYQDFLAAHLSQKAIQLGVINTAVPKAQWGTGKNSQLNSPKKEGRPQIFQRFLTKTSSSKDVLRQSSSSIEKEKEKEKEKERPDPRKSFIRSKSIANIRRPEESLEVAKTKEREDAPPRMDMGRRRSNSDLRPVPPPPMNAGIANLVDLSGPDEVVRNIIRGGIPANYRAELWLAMSGMNQKFPIVNDKPPFLDSLSYEQIEKDLGRTFPGIDFTPSGHEFQPILRRILRAYVIRNPALGYCQSMNFIAGGLLIFMEEEHAFWVLSWIVEELLHGYFTKTMVGLQVDTALFEKLVKKYLPELSKHLKAMGFSNVFCTVQWFLCMYLNNLPSEAAFRVWDLVFYAGTKVLFEVGLNIMKAFEAQIMRKQDAVDIASLLTKSLGSMFDVSPFLSQNFLKNVTAQEIKSMQTGLHLEVQTELRSRHDTLQMIELLRLTKFTKVELTDLYEQFILLDPMLNEFGINIYVFKKMLPIAFPSWNTPDDIDWESHFCQKLFDAMDCDHDSLVDFKDLMLAVSAIYRGTVKDKLIVCCKMFGASLTARVHRPDLHKLLFSVYKVVENSPDKNDKNNEGITMEKFKELVLLQPAVVKCFYLSRPNATISVRFM